MKTINLNFFPLLTPEIQSAQYRPDAREVVVVVAGEDDGGVDGEKRKERWLKGQRRVFNFTTSPLASEGLESCKKTISFFLKVLSNHLEEENNPDTLISTGRFVHIPTKNLFLSNININ